MKTHLFLHYLALAAVALAKPAPPIDAEVCVYGGTPAGVMAAVAAARHGHSVALIDINHHVGGVISGGLVNTDIGDRKTVGGLADEFLKRAVQFYRDKNGPHPKPKHYDSEPWRARYGPRIASGKISGFGKLFISKQGANGKHDATH